MITIQKNSNFSNWFDIRLFGKLIDNALNKAQAFEIAKTIQKENPTSSIVTKEEKKNNE